MSGSLALFCWGTIRAFSTEHLGSEMDDLKEVSKELCFPHIKLILYNNCQKLLSMKGSEHPLLILTAFARVLKGP